MRSPDAPRPPALRFTTATAVRADDPRAFAARPAAVAALAGYAAVWAWSAVAPLDRAEWLLEQLLPAGCAAFLALAWRARLVRLSDLSCVLVALFLALHALGARYGYEATPAGAWLAARGVGGGRNPYDRVVHLAFGVCVGYAARELWLRFGNWGAVATGRGTGRCVARGPRLWAGVHAWVAVLAASAAYEVLEWGAARLFAPGGLGSAFVGAQGDVWDAPADMAMAALGAAAALVAAEAARGATALRGAPGVYQRVVAARRHAARIRTPATG